MYIDYMTVFEMIWAGETNYAYLLPERFTSLLNMYHLRKNGRPMFHVVKERFGKNVFDLFLFFTLSLSLSISHFLSLHFWTNQIEHYLCKHKSKEVMGTCSIFPNLIFSV